MERPDPLTKYAADDRIYPIDFSAISEVVAGQTISSATVTCSPAGLTLGTPSIVSPIVSVEISSGAGPQTYDVIVTVHTSGGAIYQENIPLTMLG